MRNETDSKISAYLRLAELCGTGDESKKKYYMQQVETLLLQNEDTLEDDFLKFIDKFDYSTLKMFVMSDFIEVNTFLSNSLLLIL